MSEAIVQKTYLCRGHSPEDAESAYERWRAAAALVGPNDPFEQLVKSIWLVGWQARGEFDYGEPDP